MEFRNIWGRRLEFRTEVKRGVRGEFEVRRIGGKFGALKEIRR